MELASEVTFERLPPTAVALRLYNNNVQCILSVIIFSFTDAPWLSLRKAELVLSPKSSIDLVFFLLICIFHQVGFYMYACFLPHHFRQLYSVFREMHSNFDSVWTTHGMLAWVSGSITMVYDLLLAYSHKGVSSTRRFFSNIYPRDGENFYLSQLVLKLWIQP